MKTFRNNRYLPKYLHKNEFDSLNNIPNMYIVHKALKIVIILCEIFTVNINAHTFCKYLDFSESISSPLNFILLLTTQMVFKLSLKQKSSTDHDCLNKVSWS